MNVRRPCAADKEKSAPPAIKAANANQKGLKELDPKKVDGNGSIRTALSLRDD